MEYPNTYKWTHYIILMWTTTFSLMFLTCMGADIKAGDACNLALGMESGDLPDSSVTSTVSDSTPSSGRLNNVNGSWCVTKLNILSKYAILTIDLGSDHFVSGFSTQGPPESVFPKNYTHIIGFLLSHSRDNVTWTDYNNGQVYFFTDKNTTTDDIMYHHTGLQVELARYVRLSVTLQLSGGDTVCLRIEVYGCTIGIIPSTDLEAATTPEGQIHVKWNLPSVVTVLDPASTQTIVSYLRPETYVTYYNSENSSMTRNISSTTREVLAENTLLGATYNISLICVMNDINISCRSTEITAYLPCKEGWLNFQNQCFQLIKTTTSAGQAANSCLEIDTNLQLGELGNTSSYEVQSFILSDIIKDTTENFWLIDNDCEVEEETCCKLVKKRENRTELESVTTFCNNTFSPSICVRQSSGVGAEIIVTTVEALNNSAVRVQWSYSGNGWKTKTVQAHIQAEGASEAKTLSVSAETDNFDIVQLKPKTKYTLTIFPSENVRARGQGIHFTLIQHTSGASVAYGALLSPVPIKGYVMWKGAIKLNWDEVLLKTVGQTQRSADSYQVSWSHNVEDTNIRTIPDVSGTEYILSPVALNTEYSFSLQCKFVDQLYPCGDTIIKTELPDKVVQNSDNYVIYELLTPEMTWEEAEAACQKQGGHLTSLRDEDESRILLELFPSEDATLWTGGKLSNTASGEPWSDGSPMTYFPMARSSGITAGSESCLKAFQESGSLKISGDTCDKELIGICKFQQQALVAPPEEISLQVTSPTTINVSWSDPDNLWIPSCYEVSVCEGDETTSCVKIEDETSNNFRQLSPLKEFTKYTVKIKAYLNMTSLTTVAEHKESIMTDPSTPVIYKISGDGVVTFNGTIFIARDRGNENIQLTFSEINETTGELKAVRTIEGPANNITFTGLTPGKNYSVTLRTLDTSAGDPWQQIMHFVAMPSCDEGQYQNGQYCSWSELNGTSQSDAMSSCEKQGAELAGIEVNDGKPVFNELHTAFSGTGVWVNPLKVSEIEGCVGVSMDPSLALCLSVFVSSDQTEGNFSCVDCSWSQSYVCETTITISGGEVQNLEVVEVTSSSVTLGWSSSPSSWGSLSFLVSWAEASVRRRKRNADNELVVSGQEVTINGLQPNTSYDISVSVYLGEGAAGSPTKVQVATMEEAITTLSSTTAGMRKSALLQHETTSSDHPLLVLRIVACGILILLVGVTLVIYVAKGMFYTDCLAQLCSEIAFIGAFVCILLTATETRHLSVSICTVTAVIMQFFFLAIFLFSLLEVVALCKLLRPFVHIEFFSSPGFIVVVGWGLPALITAISGGVLQEKYVNVPANCWLDITSEALWPTVIPIGVFSTLQVVLLIAVLTVRDIPADINQHEIERTKTCFYTRWTSGVIFVLTLITWITGLLGENYNDKNYYIVFAVFTLILGVMIIVLRIVTDDQLRKTLFCGRPSTRSNKVLDIPTK
ncbi:uncharacterized protein LOC143245075 isoform X2 [Tachypleus tridentatus]|uniref:uncharacterized protein LOC143245075 isoform X2 n=1 Tax=Tachypleus tridentatus TaxID=6853 RepID=UPI003FD49463